VIVVIAILAAITIVAYTGIQERAKQSAVQSAISQGVKKVLAYAAQNGDTFPANAAAAGLPSGDVQYTVTSNNTVSPKGYCITATSQGLTYFQTSAMSNSVEGTCVGMVAWWPLNGDANDASGNSIPSTVNGATSTTGMNGVANTAYQFSNVNHIFVGTPDAFSTLPAAFTYSLWVSTTGSSSSTWPKIMGSNDPHRYFSIRGADNGAKVYTEWGIPSYTGSSWASSNTASATITPNGTWHHYAATYNGTQVKTYYNGARISTQNASINPTMAAFYLSDSGSGYVGKIDDARVYNRALTDAEVETIYRVGAQ
tara:strand:+ start:761 stop:1696 length:936 start_codon:yes stop_codon:yes gene_type:complete